MLAVTSKFFRAARHRFKTVIKFSLEVQIVFQKVTPLRDKLNIAGESLTVAEHAKSLVYYFEKFPTGIRACVRYPV